MGAFILGRATELERRRFLDGQRALGLSYAHPGMTRAALAPPGYAEDRTDIPLGRGELLFARAKAALAAWRGLQLGWLEALPDAAAIAEGACICVAVRVPGFTVLNACRVLYVLDEANRYGFAYGTLPAHAESGEELFLVERAADGTVWYRIRALSRPSAWYARAAAPLARALQKRFARESAAAMQAAVC